MRDNTLDNIHWLSLSPSGPIFIASFARYFLLFCVASGAVKNVAQNGLRTAEIYWWGIRNHSGGLLEQSQTCKPVDAWSLLQSTCIFCHFDEFSDWFLSCYCACAFSNAQIAGKYFVINMPRCRETDVWHLSHDIYSDCKQTKKASNLVCGRIECSTSHHGWFVYEITRTGCENVKLDPIEFKIVLFFCQLDEIYLRSVFKPIHVKEFKKQWILRSKLTEIIL